MTTNKQGVQRYTDMGSEIICPINNMRKSDHGDYVLYEDYQNLQDECDALRAKTSVSLGVGDGTGNLFVHGDYDSIKRVQELIFEREVLVKALELISDTDPDEGTAWFHDIAYKALESYRKRGEL